MAHFIGTAGYFQREKAINRRLTAIMTLYFLTGAACLLIGYAAGRSSLLWMLIAVALVVSLGKPFQRLLNRQLHLSRMDEHGADGEREIVKFLKDLPDTYTVISDLDFADSYGNIDHLVIGPNGIFAIDVKNWRGTVADDGKGELSLNGRPTDKPQIRYFTRRVMELRNRLTALTKLDPYVQCVFVFLRTRVEAKWGTTGAVHCIRAEQLSDYITKASGGKPLSANHIPVLIKATDALRSLGNAYKPPAEVLVADMRVGP